MSNLSEAQKEILTIEYFYPKTSITTVGAYLNVGQREPEYVRSVIQRFMEAHEAFKMKLRKNGEEVERYYVNETASILVENDDENNIKQALNEKSGRSFFEWDDYLYEMSMYVSDHGDIYIAFFGHHLIIDGIGMYLFLKDIHDLLKTDQCDQPLLSLDDCVEEEIEYQTSGRSAKSQKFWQDKVADYDGIPLADLRKIDPAQLQTTNYANELSLELSNAITAYCATQGVSLTQLISGAVLLYKSKMTNNPSVAINATLHGRSNRKKRGILSTFARALPLIINMDDELSVLEYLEKIKAESAQLMRHYKISHYDLTACTKNTSGLDDLSVSFQVDGRIKEKYYPTLIEGAWIMPKESLRPLTIHINEERFNYDKEEGDAIAAGFQLNYEVLATVYDEAFITDMHQKLELLLTQMIASAATKVKDVTLLTEEEYDFLINQMGSQYTPYPKEKTIVEIFREQVSKNPQKTALIYKDTTLTYAELDAKSNQLAHYLIENYDVKPEDKIGLLLDRSEWIIISILGVLKSGAAYVPISSEYPTKRVTYIEEMADLKTAISEVHYQDRLANPTIIQEMKLDEYPTTAPETSLKSNHLAYVLFTSGTTGRPKGVMIEHHNVINFVPAFRKACGFDNSNDETILFISNYVFDASVDQIFSALLNGDRLLISPPGLWMESEKFTDYLKKNNVTYIQMTPSLLLQVDLLFIKTLKYVLAGGESITSQLLDQMKGRHFNLINGYGPTEATVAASAYMYHGDELRNIVGYPLTNSTLYVLDANKNPVPKGTIGELYVGGVQLARGYVKQPELTAERFIPNPYQTEQQKSENWNDRLYQTGDLVRMLEDGALEYHGRSDFQVKIRGYRIELGEIEETLLQIPGITQAYVTTLGDGGNQYLGAYYVAEEAIPEEELSLEIEKSLPEYMIPSGYQHMEEFPLTVNGKLNSRALPEISMNSTVDYVAPTTELEQIVTASFEEVLELDQVGVNDDFFKLGGHSLRALRLVNLLEEKTSKAIEVKHVFEAPKVIQLASLLENLGDANYERIPEAETKDVYEMNSTQKRMYLMWKFNPTETTYNMPAVLKFDKHLDEAKLTEATHQLTARHEILRTTFAEQNGELVQVILACQKADVIVTELKEADVQQWSKRAVKSFDLENGSMYRIEIGRTKERDYLFVDMHHIIGDGMSSNIFVTELNALVAGMPLPTLERQYKDYSEWMNTQDLSASENYWLATLEDHPILELQTDHPRGIEQQFEGATEKLVLDEVTTKKVKAFIQEANTTEYMFFIGLISILLGKLANQEDLVIGSPVSGRIHKDTETMLGMFVNTLAMRLQPEGEKTFADYLAELKAQTLEAQAHQIYPFEDLVEKLVETRDRSRNPLFDVLVVYQNNEALDALMGSLSIQELEAPAKFDLTFTLSDDGKQTYIDLTYATSLFSGATIKTYLTRLTQLLDQILAATSSQIKDLNILLPQEEEILINQMGSHYFPYPKDQTIVDVFSEQVAKNPTGTAVIYNDVSLTFSELDIKSNQLAHYLIETYDVKPEDKIGLLLDRSEWMIISILGVLKAGAAYVAISPEFPQARMTYIEETAEFVTTLVEAEYTAHMKRSTAVRSLKLDDYPTTQPVTLLKPNNLAYIIFTSGTTGNPKGVMIEHHQLNNLIPSLRKVYGFGENEVTLFFANYVFDSSIEQIFLPLLSGYPMVIMPDRLWMNQAAFTAYLNKNNVTYIEMTPSFLLQADLASFSTLKYILAGGESVTVGLLDKIRELKDVRFINAYGPAEGTVATTTYEYNEAEQSNLIGTCLPNTTIYILDESRRPVPKGTIGELYIGGVQVSRGYIKQPELTAERFIPNPYQTKKQKQEGWNACIYQTGDLVRMLEDGSLEYHGRSDFQVKIRGYRIELGEIEEALLQIPGINEAHVTTLGEEGNQYLGAYYVAEAEVAQELLDAEIGKRLPEYMIPAGYQHMDEFPLTANGKLDRKALPDIGFDSAVAYVAPRTEAETVVAISFEEVLDLQQVGINDDFFKLGGHSLRALRLANLLEEKTGKAIQVKHVFEAPKVVQLANLLESLGESNYERIPQAEEKAVYEMSGAQKRMYLLWKFVPNETTYNMPAMMKFDTHLDENKIACAITALTNRHEILRTTFAEQDGILVQVILEYLETEVLVTKLDEVEIEDWYERAVKPFNLENGPLFRIEIARTEKRDYLFIDMHHIIGDGMSSNIFVNELNALVAGLPLPVLDRQYKDYSEWLKVQDLRESEHHWLAVLEDYPVLELPTDYPRPKEQMFEGATEKLVLDETTTKQIKALIQKTNTTEYMFFMGLISVLLGKLANQNDLIIGSPVSGRIHRDTESMLGMFVNTLAMRVHPNGEKLFADYLEELKAQTLEAGEHQIYPFEDLVEKLVESRDRSRNSLFDVLMVYQNTEAIDSVLGTTDWYEANPPAKFDLTFTLSENKQQTFVHVTYATSLFSEATIKTYLARFTQLLDQILADASQPIKNLNILLAEEEQALITDVGNKYFPYPKDKTIVDLFEEQVAKNPTKTALIHKDITLTYEALNAKVNQLAHYLIETYDIKPEDKIGLLLDRSEWMIISIFAVLKAGAAYVPISPEHPQDRMAYIVETAALKTTLVESHYADQLENTTTVKTLALDNYSTTNPKTGLTPTNLAYILFTSGTTGRPKGVMIEHHQVNNLIPAIRQNYRLSSEETILFFSNYVFDASVEQIYLALLNGYQLLISPDQLWMEPTNFLAYLNKHQVTYIHMTPSMLLQLDLAAIPTLKYAASGGEALTSNLIEKVSTLNLRFMNLYGPTEVTVLATTHLVEHAEVQNVIGSAIPNLTLYILDEHKRPVPKGTIGELYIGGVQVSRGYVKQPDLTAEKFISNPFQTEIQKTEGWNDRIYQSGDLVRMLEDGTLEYHGRTDFQVKIRGYRIELAEIEETLLQIPEITQAHVIAIAYNALDTAAIQHLGAYYVAEAEISQETLDQALGSKLPDYMIPSGYQHMNEFPLTVNGKLDRTALPEISFDSLASYVAPTTELEMTLVAAYEEILESERIGINDDFFKLGGHSLRALRLVNLLEEQTGKAVQVKHIFEAPKVAQLATLLESLGDSNYERIPQAEEKSAYEMSGAQKRMYLLWQYNPTGVTYNIPTLITFKQKIDETRLKNAINELTARHEILRTTFHEQDGKLIQTVSETMSAELSIEQIKETNLVSWYEKAVKPFNLETGPMYRIQIARTETNDYLFVDMHHIISDGMSSTIFAQEINQLMAGVALPALDRQYKDYSEWMHTHDLDNSKNYWLESLEDYPILELPTDHSRPAERQFEGLSEKLILNETTTKAIKALLQETKTTEYMFFIGLISILLAKLANQEDLMIGSPVSGRIHRDTESMLGMFVNTLAMRVKPNGEQTFASYLDALKTQTLAAQEHQIYPFEDLVDRVVKNRDRSRNPLFDVMMAYQNNEDLSPVMGAETFEAFNAPAKFDLTFTLSDDGKETLIDLTYATSLFNAQTIKTYLARLTQLLSQILSNANTSIKDLNILLPEEEQKLIAAVGSEYVDYPKDKTLMDLFEAQVAKTPTNRAVVYKDTVLTYEELNAKANQLAHYLIEDHDIKPEDKVGLLLDRSEWMIISILGVLKAGAAYVPISPEHPKDRMAYIAETADFKTALVEAHYADQLEQTTIVQELELANYPASNPKTGLTATNLAYILFTSGTTGRPKGVMLEHHQVNNLIQAMKEIHNLNDEGEILLFFTNYVFDPSVEQIFLSLFNGYTMVVSPDNLWMEPDAFTAYLNEHQVTYIHMTPSMLLQIHLDSVPTLKHVVSGGESLTRSLIDKARDLNFHFVNLYGPTEVTVNSTSQLVDINEERNIIGSALPNTTLYVLDTNKQPVPLGTIGELYIGGVQVSRGYVKQPDLTAEKFIPNPYQTKAQKEKGWNDRLYQTGDLVRMLEDGTLEYHGRSDFQVKIRGYRIELAEIEETLLQVPGIKQAHVMAILDGTDNQHLGAYYVAETEISQERLDAELGKKLPEYMIPTGYQHLEAFPLTVNGKLDRKALPEIGLDSATEYVAPTTALEIMITTSFEEILDMERIGIHDDFFKLGGHSLRALRLVNLLKERTGKAVQVRHIFEASKVAQLAIILEKLEDATQYERIPKAEEKPVYDMSPSQRRLYTFWKYMENANGVGNNMPMLSKFTARIDESQMQKVFETLVARHEIYRTTFREQDGRFVQMIHETMPVHVPVEHVKEMDIETWFNATVKSFDLEKGPMYSIKIARSETHDYLFLDLHHIISDGRSHTNLGLEMSQLFAGIPLPPLDRQYRDYSEWLRTQDQSKSEQYWLAAMKDYPVLQLELDYPRPPVQDFAVGRENLVLNETETKQIKALIKQTNSTEYMFFLAMISILLGKLAQQEDVVIGSPMSGRIHQDLDAMMGMIVNSLPMRVGPENHKSFNAYLEEMKIQTLAAYEHQTYPLDILKQQLVEVPDPSRHALYDVLYVYQNNEAVEQASLGVSDWKAYEIPEKLDLNYTLSDNGTETFIELTYASSLFKPETIKAYQASLRKLINQVLEDSEQTIQELDI